MRSWTNALVAALVVLVVIGCGAGADETAAEEAARFVAGPGPSRYEVAYDAGDTAVLDCVLANRTFSASVDLQLGVMELRQDGARDTSVIVTEDAAFVHRSLFAPGSLATEWLDVDDEP